MESQFWIIAQIVIDVFLVAILLLFVRFQFSQHKSDRKFQSAFEQSKAILSEMKQISLSLEQNLEQKKALSREILSQLDEGLIRAKKTHEQLSEIIRISGDSLQPDPNDLKDSDHIKSAVTALLAKGLTREEIALYMGISISEIDLFMKLSSQTDKKNKSS
ncbi:hypothetical protein ACFL9T_09580 [Thermodesulfobacteriota bacterium]